MHNSTLAYWTVPFFAYSLLACNADEAGEGRVELPIASSEAALTATDNSEKALNGLLNAVDFLVDSGTLAELLGVLGADDASPQGDCAGAAPLCGPDNLQCTDPPDDPCLKLLAPEGGMAEETQELRDGIADIVTALREHVFTDENIESTTDTSVTYLLGPSLLCGDDEDGGALDPSCVSRAEFVQPRLRLTSPHEGDIDITLLVGADRHEPMQLQLYAHSLGLEVDLGQTLAFARDLGEIPDELESLTGVFQVQLIENGEMDYSVRLNILKALELSVRTEDNEPVTVSVGASSPALDLNVNGATQTLQMLHDWSSFRLLAPLSSLAGSMSDDDDATPELYGNSAQPAQPEHEYTGVIEMLLSGFSGTFSYTADSDEISISNFGFGNQTSTLMHDGNLLAALDLNANTDRRLSYVVKALEEGGLEVTLDAPLALQIEFAFKNIADQFEELPDFLLEDTLGLSLSGASPALALAQEQIAVTSGSLSLTSSSVPGANFDVAEGMCLGEAAESEEPPAHEILSSLAAVVCE